MKSFNRGFFKRIGILKIGYYLRIKICDIKRVALKRRVSGEVEKNFSPFIADLTMNKQINK